MWVRGLKLLIAIDVDDIFNVAPHVGAWIETSTFYAHPYEWYVAPHVGAWIETFCTSSKGGGQ